MAEITYNITLAIIIFPLLGAILAGLFGSYIGKRGAHWITISGVAISFFLSLIILKLFVIDDFTGIDAIAYTWLSIGKIHFEVGFLIDPLTALMMSVVTFVSLMVHIYSIGYMVDDPGYTRFFSYISLFTFAMLTLVAANNFMQLFFGWEAVGVVSYLLIGFWFKKDSAVYANLKAFLVNRVGDLGFLLGIAAVLFIFGSLDYHEVFKQTAQLASQNMYLTLGGLQVNYFTIIGILLFIGAMGKSAQIPLHVWLPDSMEGPTPISALIHAATMVTAGVFMVARMSPIFEYSEAARSLVLIIGSTSALFLGILGIVQSDIKRVIAYSTLSQLGYMVAALGVSAYAAGVFHLVTHAFFKALLFLGAGSVIIACHHEQNIWKMGGLKKYLPITYITFLIGTLALVGFPGFAGFYSKDMIIEAVAESSIFGSTYAYFCVMSGVLVTSLYSFRLLFVVFHGKERMDAKTKAHLHESPWVVWVPLVLLAIPSLVAGVLLINRLLFAGDNNFFQNAIFVLPENNILQILSANFHGVYNMALDGFTHLPFMLIVLGFAICWLCYYQFTAIPQLLSQKLNILYRILQNNYGVDKFNQRFFADGSCKLGNMLWQFGDVKLIDGLVVNGSAYLLKGIAHMLSMLQRGYVVRYVLFMSLGLILFFILLVS